MKAIISVLFLLFTSALAIDAQGKIETNSAEVNAMLNKDKKLVVLDVRTAEEFKEGHIKGAINIDIRQPDALARINKLDRNAKYIVHCRTNHRSKIAVDHMVQNGFKTVYQMMDGFNGWSMNRLPIVK
ncbi:MAG TPA: rhodanese-like domain-containing protein [Bacteroidales bacterium]